MNLDALERPGTPGRCLLSGEPRPRPEARP